MTDIPDEIVERVARDIYNALPRSEELKSWSLLPTHSPHKLGAILQARAALTSCRYMEMREALLAIDVIACAAVNVGQKAYMKDVLMGIHSQCLRALDAKP